MKRGQPARSLAYRNAGRGVAGYLCTADTRSRTCQAIMELAGRAAQRRARSGRRATRCQPRSPVAADGWSITAEGIVLDNWPLIEALAEEMLRQEHRFSPSDLVEFLQGRLRATD